MRDSSDRVQFRKKALGFGLLMLLTVTAGCTPPTTVEPSTSTLESTPMATTTSTVDITTTAPTVETAPSVIVGSGGVLGWWDGEWNQAEAAEAVPLEAGTRMQLVGPIGSTGTAIASGARPGCEFVDGHVTVDLEPDPYAGYDPFQSKPLAVSADWDLTPYPVEELSLESDIYSQIVSDHLATRGLIDPDPVIVQLYRVDLENDGEDEVIIAADNHDGEFFQQGVYSIVLVRLLINETVETAVLHESIVPADLGSDEFPFSVVARVAAVADLDADGALEIAVDTAYHEGAGTELWDYVDNDLGFVAALVTGCGA